MSQKIFRRKQNKKNKKKIKTDLVYKGAVDGNAMGRGVVQEPKVLSVGGSAVDGGAVGSAVQESEVLSMSRNAVHGSEVLYRS
jgi:hypothetical protein